jgi:acyl-CoA synthetase (AMP-forming)/AMP-acid ligase II
MDGVEVRILDPDSESLEQPLEGDAEGLVAIKAPSMMSGYVDGDSAFNGGYFLTGDLGRLDDDGSLTITGRLKNLIDIGGMKVNPAEVEQVLRAHGSVAECVVLPMPVTPTVSRLKAVVVPVAGCAEIDVDELRRFARDRLAGYKVPRVVEVRQSLPRSPSGKILRAQLEVPG